MGLISSIFGNKTQAIEEYKAKGAIVIDVRSTGEFQGGHVKGAKNIPLPDLEKRKNEILHYKKPVVFCCASGMRSGSATSIMKKEGLDCINGGGWMSVNAAWD